MYLYHDKNELMEQKGIKRSKMEDKNQMVIN